MAATYLSLHFHLIFGTKDRLPMIERDWRDRLHAFMGGILREMNAIPESIGGVADHVHILAGLRATHRLSDILHDVKKSSSAWVHGELKHSKFAWQAGYAALTVSPSQIESVKNYVEQQEQHHRHRTFQEEYLDLLLKAGIEFDSRQVWG